MELTRFDDVRDFLAAAGAFLVAREAEHNLLLGVAGSLRDHPDAFNGPAYLAVVGDGREVLLAAIRTPPYGALLSEAVDPAALEPLVADLFRYDRGLRGVAGPTGLAREFARRWTASTGRAASLEIAERVYRLSQVRRPRRQPPGNRRLADERDHRLLAEWLVAFHREAVPNSPQPADPDVLAGRWITRRGMHLWTFGEQVLSMVGAGSTTPNGIRIAPVYTPPAERGRGFASALTAAVSQDQLDAGRRFCFLFTDLANPTSNHIYQAIGYKPVCDVDQYVFVDRNDAVSARTRRTGGPRPGAVPRRTGRGSSR